jgi:heme-degrading monooxygenase HmoA
MFTRIVSMQLKPNSSGEFSELFEKEVLPLLRKQQGFRDEMLFVDPGGPELVVISLWESKELAESYSRTAYPEVLKIFARVLDGTPKVRSFRLAHSTFYKTAIAAAASQSSISTQTPGVGG